VRAWLAQQERSQPPTSALLADISNVLTSTNPDSGALAKIWPSRFFFKRFAHRNGRLAHSTHLGGDVSTLLPVRSTAFLLVAILKSDGRPLRSEPGREYEDDSQTATRQNTTSCSPSSQ